ncbi:hypothetical protein [Thalassospira xiamenensis]|uniref:hypothetical protein n=1 Tax=Thalassospira xiamenensis TaxID=220697 RepID=UPI00241DE170|nr:hypothetical protein [Thalassospira xiamenensis]
MTRHKHRYPERGQTALEEAIKSNTVLLYAPRWLDTEMRTSAIPQVERRKGIAEEKLLILWESYKSIIIWDDRFCDPEEGEDSRFDEKDRPYVDLQKCLQAHAIFSRDKDIDTLGGNRVNMAFILSARDYARARKLYGCHKSGRRRCYPNQFIGLGWDISHAGRSICAHPARVAYDTVCGRFIGCGASGKSDLVGKWP